MNVNIKAIILDMDGTMLNHENQMSDNLHRQIKKLRKDGKRVFIATGRTKKELEAATPDDLELDGMLCANGMISYIDGKPLKQHALAPELVRQLVDRARESGIYYEVHPAEGDRVTLKKDKTYFEELLDREKPPGVKEDEWRERQAAMREEISWPEELPSGKIAKMYFFHPDKAKNDRWKQLLEGLRKQTNFAAFSSSDNNVEVMEADVSKATGIKHLLDKFHLTTEDILMVGDSENDLPLLQLAAHAVAMKNAPEHVKTVADEVTEFSYKEDGLYRFLKKKFGE